MVSRYLVDSLLAEFWWQGVAWSGKYSRWKSSGWLVYDLGRLELTVIAGQFGHLCREAYRKISRQASMEASN